MKNILLLIFLSAFLILFTPSGGLSEGAVGPKIFFEENEFDAKEIKSGDYLEHTFKVYNRGDGILEISKVKTS